MGEITNRVVFDGNHGLITRELNEDCTAYVADAKKWGGLASVDVTFTQPQSTIAADDDPDWLTINGVPTGTGTITLNTINIHEYGEFIACIAETGQGVSFGEDLPTVNFGMSVEENISNGDLLKHIFFKCRATNIPEFKATTRKNGEPAARQIAIPIAISPVFYTKADGKRGRKIYNIMHSEVDKTGFDANKDTILFPGAIE